MKQGILDGIRVIDFTKAIAGPLCGSYLADMGAEVIKVEGPKGDPSRMGKPGVGAFAAYFTNVNRGKKSIARLVEAALPGPSLFIPSNAS